MKENKKEKRNYSCISLQIITQSDWTQYVYLTAELYQRLEEDKCSFPLFGKFGESQMESVFIVLIEC